MTRPQMNADGFVHRRSPATSADNQGGGSVKSRTLQILALVVVLVLGAMMMKPASKVPVVVAATDLPRGHRITDQDLAVVQLPANAVPKGAFQSPDALVGQVVRFSRAAGDFILPQHVGAELLMDLQPDERGIGVPVNAAGGLAGLLQPGDTVDVIAVLESGDAFNPFVPTTTATEGQPDQNAPLPPPSGPYAKLLLTGLRVLYVSPDFRAPETSTTSQESGSSLTAAPSRGAGSSGVVVLAVPVNPVSVVWDFGAEAAASPVVQTVNAAELLSAVVDGGASIRLLLDPKEPAETRTAGVYLQSLIVPPPPEGTPEPQANPPGGAP